MECSPLMLGIAAPRPSPLLHANASPLVPPQGQQTPVIGYGTGASPYEGTGLPPHTDTSTSTPAPAGSGGNNGAGPDPVPTLEEVYAHFLQGGGRVRVWNAWVEWAACFLVWLVTMVLTLALDWHAMRVCAVAYCGEITAYARWRDPRAHPGIAFAYVVFAAAGLGTLVHAVLTRNYTRRVAQVAAWFAAQGISDAVLPLCTWQDVLQRTVLSRMPGGGGVEAVRHACAARLAHRDDVITCLLRQGAPTACCGRVPMTGHVWSNTLLMLWAHGVGQGSRDTPWGCDVLQFAHRVQAVMREREATGAGYSVEACVQTVLAPREGQAARIRQAWGYTRVVAWAALPLWPFVCGFVAVWYAMLHTHKYVMRAGRYWGTRTLTAGARWTGVRARGMLRHEWSMAIDEATQALQALHNGMQTSFGLANALNTLFLVSVCLAVPLVLGAVHEQYLLHLTLGGHSMLYFMLVFSGAVSLLWNSRFVERRPVRGDDWSTEDVQAALLRVQRCAPGLVAWLSIPRMPALQASAASAPEGDFFMTMTPEGARKSALAALEAYTPRAQNVCLAYAAVAAWPCWVLCTRRHTVEDWARVMVDELPRTPAPPRRTTQSPL